jgi:glutamine synthetase
VPARRGLGTRVEVRVPDPSCNPYLAFTVMLRSGLDGVDRRLDPGPPVNHNIFEMSEREKKRLKITQLPANLKEALDCLRRDQLLQAALGDHVFTHFLEAKEAVWADYAAQVHAWEIDRYLSGY